MKNKVLIFSLCCLVFLSVSCDNDDAEPIGESTEIEWILGSETLDTIQTIDSNGEIILEIGTEILCQTRGVRVIITSDNDEWYNDLVTEFPFSFERDISERTTVIIHTVIERLDPEPLILCFWLGEVNCKLQYYN